MLKFKLVFLITALALVSNTFSMEGEAAGQGDGQELGVSGFQQLDGTPKDGAPSQEDDAQAQKADGEGLMPDVRPGNDEENEQASASTAYFFTKTRTALLAFGVSVFAYLVYNFYNNKTEVQDQEVDEIIEQS